MSVDERAYAAAVREAADGGVPLERFRDPIPDTQFLHLAEPVEITVNNQQRIAEAADTDPWIYESGDYLALREDDEVLFTYNRETEEMTLNGNVFHRVVAGPRDSSRGRIYERLAGERNPIYRRARETAESQGREDADRWLNRAHHVAYGQVGLAAGAAASWIYGMFSGDPVFMYLSGGISLTTAATIPTIGAYMHGGVEGARRQAAEQRADELVETVGAVSITADTSPVVDDWLDALDPDTETPRWLAP
ncbi:MAG: hypothetical protein SVW77_02005 [Candidatus Nanohaloarchaea archaeon]|nr:hypothetical protein [Candidatus Nanohaloarchaea archaeon]